MSKALAYDILLYLQILVNKICTIMKICHYSTDMRSRKDNGVRLFFIKKSLNGNRRTIYVFLTDFGLEMQKEVEKMFSLLEDMAFEGISKEEREIFLDVFLKIYDNLKSEKGEY